MLKLKLNKKNLAIVILVALILLLIWRFGYLDVTGDTPIIAGDFSDLTTKEGVSSFSFVADRPNPVGIIVAAQKPLYLPQEKNQNIKLVINKESNNQAESVISQEIDFSVIPNNGYLVTEFTPIQQSTGTKFKVVFESNNFLEKSGVYLYPKGHDQFLAPRIIYREYFRDVAREISHKFKQDHCFTLVYLTIICFFILLISSLYVFDFSKEEFINERK